MVVGAGGMGGGVHSREHRGAGQKPPTLENPRRGEMGGKRFRRTTREGSRRQSGQAIVVKPVKPRGG